MTLFWLEAAGVGLVSGILSGMFGIGGGLITTPAIRLLLHGSALSAVATPLPVIIPTSITGALSYRRRGLSDVRAGLLLGVWGALAAVAGAFAASYVGGTALLLVTAALLAFMAVDMTRFALRTPAGGAPAATSADPLAAPAEPSARVAAGDCAAGERAFGGAGAEAKAPSLADRPLAIAAAGIATGLYSGLLGLGGGFVLVPMLTRWFGYETKRAIGTSLVAIAVLAIPGTITHYLLGHIDLTLALALSVTVIPGSLIGSRVTQAASERHVRVGFAALLVVAAVLLAVNELAGLR